MIILLSVACEQPRPQQTTFKIGVVVRNENKAGDKELLKELKANFDKLVKASDDDYYLVNRSGEDDQEIQLAMIDELLKDGVDLLIVELVQIYAAATVVAKAIEVGVPVIFINVQPGNDADIQRWPGMTIFVGGYITDGYDMLAQYLNRQDNNGDTNNNSMLDFSWFVTDPTFIDKETAGHYNLSGSYSSELKDYEIVKNSKAAVKYLLKSKHYKELDAVFYDDLSIAGEILTIKKAGLYILALDVNPLSDDLPDIDAIVIPDYPKQAAKTAEMTKLILQGKSVDIHQLIDWKLVNK